MRPKSLILIVIALGCGLVASIGISQVLEQKTVQAVPEVEMENIFVAIEEVDINEAITPEMIKLEPWPADKIPEGAIRELENIESRRPRSRLFAGEVVLEGKLFGSEEDRGASKLIPKGFRVHAVSVSAESSVSGLILPGDRVDVLVYLQIHRQDNPSMKKQVTRTILTNCRVFAVNEQIHRQTDENGNSIAAKTVSLLVTPKQVEILVLASRLGSLSLSLRPPDEDGDDIAGKTDDATIQELLGLTEDADPKEEKKQESLVQKEAPKSSGGFLDFLKSQASNLSSSNIGMPQQPAGPEWTMDLLSPDGVRRFEFGDGEELPIEVAPGARTMTQTTSMGQPPVPATSNPPALPPGPRGSSSLGGNGDAEPQDSGPGEPAEDHSDTDVLEDD